MPRMRKTAEEQGFLESPFEVCDHTLCTTASAVRALNLDRCSRRLRTSAGKHRLHKLGALAVGTPIAARRGLERSSVLDWRGAAASLAFRRWHDRTVQGRGRIQP